MNVVWSLFSGVGGLDEGLRRAGWRHTLMCEADPYRRDVLRARFPGVPVADDIRSVPLEGWDEIDRLRRTGQSTADSRSDDGADLVCGGFPCQDLSVAGKRAGLNGSRSGLFFEFARIIDAVRPRWVLVENVPGLLSSNGGRDFGVVLGTLADIGYGLAWRVLDSRYFGVPQRRRRVFVVGARADGDPRAASVRAGQVLAVGSRCPGHPATRGKAREDVAAASLSGLGTGGPDDNDAQGGRLIAAPLSHGSNNAAGRRREDDFNLVAGPLGGGNDGIGRRSEDDPNLVTELKNKTLAVHTQASVRRLMPTECERLQGFPDGWTQLGDIADSKRYAALGDAVTVPVAEWIGHRILAAEDDYTSSHPRGDA